MLYVSAHLKEERLYGVTDTDDNTTEWLSFPEVLRIAKELRKSGVEIKGVTSHGIHVVKVR